MPVSWSRLDRWEGAAGVALLAALVSGVVLGFWWLRESTDVTNRAMPVQGAAILVEAIQAIRDAYSHYVVEPAKTAGIEVTHDFRNRLGSIPLPASMTMELGRRLREIWPGADIRLRSDYPFPWRNEGPSCDPFEAAALQSVRQTPGKPFYRFEDYQGRYSLRYAVAEVMTATCVSCHNSYPGSPKTDWQIGDVRGILEVIRPLDDTVAQARSSQETILGTTAGLSALALAGLSVIHVRLRRARRRLEITASAAENLAELRLKYHDSRMRESAMAHRRDLAEAANAAKGEFLATMSHELRTPLNGIIGMNELLAQTELDERQRRFVAACGASGKMLLQIVNDVLDLSKIDAGKLELNHEECRPAAVVGEIVDLFRQGAEQKGIELACYVDPAADVAAVCDRDRLRQILVNLVGNALKFTSAGQVALRLEYRAAREPLIDLRFAVSDTGIGIPDDKLPSLFLPFTQADSSTTRNYGGTGLGLTICKRLAEMMGGQIGAESQLHVGSVFWVDLPLSVLPDEPALQAARDGLRGVCVLSIADPFGRSEQIDACLAAWGCAVAHAATVGEALAQSSPAAAGGTPWGAILVDLRLIVGDEGAWTQLVERGTPTIGWGMAEQECDEAGIASLGLRHVLAKPVEAGELFAALTAAVGLTYRPLEVALPRAAAPAPTIDASVLLAEDNSTNQLYVVELLKQYGCTCDLAANGREALEMARRQTYDVVLMDCQMPEMDGFTATREIRAHEARQPSAPHLPIVALTANALRGDRERCLAAGMDDYLSKPVEAQALRAVLERFAGSRGEEPPAPPPEPPAATVSSEVFPPDAAPIDRAALLARCFGKVDFALSLLDDLATSGSAQFAAVRKAFDQGDAAAAGAAAHALKGAAGILCAESLRAAAARAEALGKAGNLEELQTAVETLAEELQACLDQLPTLRKEIQSAGAAASATA